MNADVVATEKDASYGMARSEVHCRRCGSHLGHVFRTGYGRLACVTASISVSLVLNEQDKR
jgi:peptide methionine sulfoxide reductase MsrB